MSSDLDQYGASHSGRKVELTENLSVKIPYGMAWRPSDDGKVQIIKFSKLPQNYRDGVFSVEEVFQCEWRLMIQRSQIVDCHADNEAELSPEAVQEFMRQQIKELALKWPNSSSHVFFDVSDKVSAVLCYNSSIFSYTQLLFMVEDAPSAFLVMGMMVEQYLSAPKISAVKKDIEALLQTIEITVSANSD